MSASQEVAVEQAIEIYDLVVNELETTVEDLSILCSTEFTERGDATRIRKYANKLRRLNNKLDNIRLEIEEL